MSNTLLITAGPFQFLAEFEADAPQTVQAFRKLLPYEQKLIHVRWSGEGLWIPLGTTDLGLSFENHTAHPSAGQILLYPGGFSETEILFCYGGVAFASKMGALAANHFLTITAGMSNLRALGEKVLWEGAQPVRFESADEDFLVERDGQSFELMPLTSFEVCSRIRCSVQVCPRAIVVAHECIADTRSTISLPRPETTQQTTGDLIVNSTQAIANSQTLNRAASGLLAGGISEDEHNTSLAAA
ncbi:hypothetical protein LTR56_002831 [Elasticomyces elasticus]|nr:hypothetical protein LTR56_002831 [Elasticomyces elasticus]KAK3666712.1 hypothetical protein LTR22_002299 [Elasticomyces elasticus]KAK4920446.1 hypothetical protein LTR49_012038 [Elasticomyces elasticus]KAK5759267.1 hypothetical protein LTS12_010590 [Elasticomyces elasticus]